MTEIVESLTEDQLRERLELLIEEYGFPLGYIHPPRPIVVSRTVYGGSTDVGLFRPNLAEYQRLHLLLRDPRFIPLFPVSIHLHIAFEHGDPEFANALVACLQSCPDIKLLLISSHITAGPVLNYIRVIRPVLKLLKVRGLTLNFHALDMPDREEMNEFVRHAVCASSTISHLSISFSLHYSTVQSLALWTAEATDRRLHLNLRVTVPDNVNQFPNFDFRNIEYFQVTPRPIRAFTAPVAMSLLGRILLCGRDSALRNLTIRMVYTNETVDALRAVMRRLRFLTLEHTPSSWRPILPILYNVRHCWQLDTLIIPNLSPGAPKLRTLGNVVKQRIIEAVRWHPTLQAISSPGDPTHPSLTYLRRILYLNRQWRYQTIRSLTDMNRLRYPEFNDFVRSWPYFTHMRNELYFMELIPGPVFILIMRYVGYETLGQLRYVEGQDAIGDYPETEPEMIDENENTTNDEEEEEQDDQYDQEDEEDAV